MYIKPVSNTETPISPQTFPIMVLCDGITLPANIGAIFRLADAFGVEKIIFGGEGVITSGRKVKQVSRSTHQWVSHSQTPDLEAEISKLKAEGYQIIALEITDKSRPVQEMEVLPDQKFVIVVGSEMNGISQHVLNISDKAFHIPFFGRNSSMNVSNALAVVLYSITRKLA